MSDSRDSMRNALHTVVVPRLREMGFAGSFPHLRRIGQSHIDLITFQFDRHGGGFIIEIGQCGAEGFTTHWGKKIVPKHVTAWNLPIRQRARVQPRPGSGTDAWFRYDVEDPGTESQFHQVAESVLPFLDQIKEAFDNFSQIKKVGES